MMSISRRRTNNHPRALQAKVEIRNRVLDMIGPDKASVFDAFAGEGQLFKQSWVRAHRYIGCDLTWYRDERLLFVADCRRVMRAIDLRQFSIFDIDSWGSPWEVVLILCGRRPLVEGERVGIVLTEGSGLKIKFGSAPTALAILAGIRPNALGQGRAVDELVDRAIAGLARRLDATVLKRWEAHGKTGAAMRYIGLVLEGQKKAAQAEARTAVSTQEPLTPDATASVARGSRRSAARSARRGQSAATPAGS